MIHILSLFNTLAVPTQIYGSETWALKKHDQYRSTAAEMKILNNTAKIHLA